MKKLMIACAALAMITGLAVAGELVTLPKYLVVTEKITKNQVDKHRVTFFYGPPAYAEVVYYVLGVGTGGFTKQVVKVQGPEFTAFVAGYGATLKSRADAIIYTAAQSKYDTQDTP